ncbi:MAG TPA: hypothetical protein VEV41_21255 [Terriglobales bacterium]|jgi:hypothetical protein|nr:hypothetical protein [Terriglobales bacterium]
MVEDKKDWRELYEAIAKEDAPDKLEALTKELNEAMETEEREKKCATSALRKSYIVKRKAS